MTYFPRFVKPKRDPYMERILQNTPKETSIRKRLLLQGKGVKPYYYKNQAPSRSKVRIIYPLLHSRAVRISSDLTFGGYLAGTTPVLSVRSFLFAVQVLFGTREDRVTYWWYFRHHQYCIIDGHNKILLFIFF